MRPYRGLNGVTRLKTHSALALFILPVLVACGGAPTAPQGISAIPASNAQSVALKQPTPAATQSPPPKNTRFANTWGRFAPFQVFDYYQQTNTSMSNAEIAADAYRYSSVWASFNPAAWHAAKPAVFTSHYYLPEEDSNAISGHDITWFQTNHPDWIMYACDTNNNPTTQYAYTGVGFPDVVLDMRNPLVVDYEIRQSLGPYLIANHYRAAALDQVVFSNVEVGGNPELGQKVISGYYGCGIYLNGTFVRRYTGSKDPAFATDVINWVKTARSIFTTDPTIGPHHLAILVNHPVGSTSDPNDIALAQNVDMEMTESGFADYGNYQLPGAAGVFGATVNWMKWLQAQNVAIGIIDKFDNDARDITTDQFEYSLATYAMGKEQGAYLYTAGANGSGYGYGAEQWHPEYAIRLGAPCAEMYGGSTYDPKNPQIWYRRFNNGMTVVNSGSLPIASEMATLPTNHTYTDIESRAVTNPLSVSSNDAYVLQTKNGTGCL